VHGGCCRGCQRSRQQHVEWISNNNNRRRFALSSAARDKCCTSHQTVPKKTIPGKTSAAPLLGRERTTVAESHMCSVDTARRRPVV
jgi:predicted Fe-S protein YdhL (DUF1289 family)